MLRFTAGLHRTLGSHMSYVRSLNFDCLSDEEIKMMYAGGNQRFLDAVPDNLGKPMDSVPGWLFNAIISRYVLANMLARYMYCCIQAH